MPLEKQAAKIAARAKYAPLTLICAEACAIQLKLKDPLLFNAFQLLEKGDNAAPFLQLYQYAKEGRLKAHDTFTEICEVLADRTRRDNSENVNLKFGVRYPEQYMNWMVLMRSYGQNSGRQYGILTSVLGGPSTCQLRYVSSSIA